VSSKLIGGVGDGVEPVCSGPVTLIAGNVCSWVCICDMLRRY
jgi:hypothetical protein